MQPDQIEAAHNRFGPDVTYVPVVAQEASGHNAIPRTLAEFYAARAGARTAQGTLPSPSGEGLPFDPVLGAAIRGAISLLFR